MDCRLHRSRVLSLHYLSIAQQEELARTPVAFEMKSKFPHRPEITAKVQTRYVLEGDNGLTSTGTRLKSSRYFCHKKNFSIPGGSTGCRSAFARL